MTFKHSVLAIAFAIIGLSLSGQVVADDIFMTIKGPKGQIKGDATAAGFENRFKLLRLDHGFESQRDITGVTKARQVLVGTISLTRLGGFRSAELLAAARNNEPIEVNIDVYAPRVQRGATGAAGTRMARTLTLELRDARITEINRQVNPASDTEFAGQHIETLKLVFTSMKMRDESNVDFTLEL